MQRQGYPSATEIPSRGVKLPETPASHRSDTSRKHDVKLWKHVTRFHTAVPISLDV